MSTYTFTGRVSPERADFRLDGTLKLSLTLKDGSPLGSATVSIKAAFRKRI